jgi:hypothetical protein
MKLQELFQKGASQTFKDFLDKNPELVRKYVDTSIVALNYVLVPVTTFVKHLLTVKGLDPNSEPGKQELLALLGVFEKFHQSEYDDDYDVSWVQKKFDKVREDARWGDLTQETFVGLTDISNLTRSESSGPFTIDQEVNQIAPVSAKREIPLIDEDQERENLKAELKSISQHADQYIKGEVATFNPGDALQQLVDIAQKAGVFDAKKEKTTKKKPGIKTTKKKLNKKITRKPTPGIKESVSTPVVNLDNPEDRKEFRAQLAGKAEKAQALTAKLVKMNLLPNDAVAIAEQVAQNMMLNDDALESLERVLDKMDKPQKSNFKGSFRRY